jgi:hypothetical protein
MVVLACGHERTMSYLQIDLSLQAAAMAGVRRAAPYAVRSARRRGWRRT